MLFLSSLLTGVVGSLSCLSGDIETFIATRFVIGLLLPVSCCLRSLDTETLFFSLELSLNKNNNAAALIKTLI